MVDRVLGFGRGGGAGAMAREAVATADFSNVVEVFDGYSTGMKALRPCLPVFGFHVKSSKA